jgi:hypothetical protein
MSKKQPTATATFGPCDAAPEPKSICLDAATMSSLMHFIDELLEHLESYQRFAEAHAFRRFVVDGLRWSRVCLSVLHLESELARLRLSPHNRSPAMSGGPLHVAAYWELAHWLLSMRSGSTDTFGQKLAGRWLDGLLLPVLPDGRSATPDEIEHWRQTPLPDMSADLRLLRLIAVDFHHIVAGGSVRVTTKPFIPTARQRKILALLKGKAKKLAQLATILKVKEPTLCNRYLRELREQGLVVHNKRIGYYRPDAPPPELAGT